MGNDYKPKIGEELLATFSDYPEGVGTLYSCTKVTDTYFTVIEIKNINTTGVTTIPEAERKTYEILFSSIPIINLHRKFNFGRV